jgi:hypothetical protein
MNRFFLCAFAFLLLGLGACNNDTPNDNNNRAALSEEDQALVDNIKMSAPVTLEPQPVFDQSQLNDNALGLCMQFKSLRNGNRTEIFNKLEPLLPNCPTEMGADNTTKANFDEAVQRMRYEDLVELLGEPDEADTQGTFAYYLTDDEGYKVVFLSDEQGNIACRYYEGNS